MRWSKVMSTTDAQQPTTGRVVPYLRFIKGSNPQDNQVWFRNTFFQAQSWKNGFFGNHPVEECSVSMDVSIAGVAKGMRKFTITHDANRMANNSTPNTWLHYDQATVNDLLAFDTTGMTFSVELIKGSYKLDIS